jgi:peptidoglycan hydrolase-like protein with peptidoglycan-binding domain
MTYRDRQKLQVALSSLGFDVEAVDGTFGPRTRQMIGAWQIKSGNISTGFFTAAQKNALLNEAAPAIAKWEDEQRRASAEKQKHAAAEKQRRASADEEKRTSAEEQQWLQQQPASSQRQSGWKWPWH